MENAQVDTSEGGGQWGTGGMATKLTAARLATAAGCTMAICGAAEPERVVAIVHGERIGTVFRPLPHTLRWAAHFCIAWHPIWGECFASAQVLSLFEFYHSSRHDGADA